LIKHLKFESYKDISLILIGKDLKLLVSEISNCQIVYDHYTLNSLNDESRKYLLQKYVKFQSKQIMLKDLIGVKDDDIYSNEIMNIFDSFETSMIAKLIDDEIFEIDPDSNLKSNCDDIKNFYIDRTFKRNLLFEKRILNDEQLMKTNTIVDTQIKYQELIATHQSRNQIHLFDHSDQSGYLKWIRSSGSVSQIKKYLVKDDQYASTYKEEEFFNQDEKLMIITDEPGKGKTTFLKSIIHKSEEKNHIYFIHICLNNFVNELFEYRKHRRENVKDYMSYLLNDFLKSLKLTTLQVNLFKLFSKTGKLIILFDGLDEVIDYKKDMVEIVSNLEKNHNLKKIIITTRTHLKKELEDELGVITYRLIKFDKENQIEFLKKYWLNEAREHYKLTEETEIEIVNFAKILVEKFNRIVTNRINDFIGIPLQIRMLADMFRENVTNFIMEKKLELVNELKSIIDLENIAQFYERFLESKFDDKYIFKDGNVIARDLDRYEEEKENYYDNHFEYSFQLIFKKCIRKRNSKENECQKLMKRITKFGIIIQFNEYEPRFLHESYAEFFIAKQIVSNKLNYQEFKPEIKRIFENKDFILIRKFIDNILMKSCDEIIINKSDISFDLIKVACVENLYFLLKYFIEKVDININEKDPEGMSLFLYACQFGHSEIIKLIIERKNDIINENDNDGFNGLHHSSKNGHLEAVKILIQAGIDFNGKDSSEKTSIHYASKYGHKDIIDFLIKNCQIDINEKDKYGKNGFHFASEWGFIEIVKSFLDNGIEINSKDNKGMNALHYSIMHGHKDIALLLISKQIDINDIRNDGKSALHFAAEMGNVDIAKWLIDLGIDIKQKDNSGLNALHYSSEFGHKEIVQLLIEKGVDINEKDSFGKNAFDYALRYGRKEVMEYLIEKGIDLKKNNEFDLSALHFAAIQGQKEIVKILIDNGLDINEKDRNGKNAFLFACEWGRKEVVELLLEKEIDINEKDNSGMNALHYATKYGHKELVKILIQKGLNKHEKDNYGKDSIYYAVSYSGKEFFDLI
jgi:ankyrin repeat protein